MPVALVALAVDLGLLEAVMIARAASGAGEAAGDALDQRVLVDVQLDDMVERAVPLRQDSVERVRLRLRPRIAVEDDAGVGGERIERFADDARHDLVRHQFARFHHGLRLEADRRARLDRRAQHVAGRQLHHGAAFHQARRLRALARARRAKQNDVHCAHTPLFVALGHNVGAPLSAADP